MEVKDQKKRTERTESLAREVYLRLLESPAAATTKPEALVEQAWAKARAFYEYQPEG